jgi:two-component system sensor histidine kinase KdpD
MTRGTLRIYLGAAPGVGKTYAMLAEGNRRRSRGTDVVIGYVETYGRIHTIEQLGDLEIVPRRRVEYRGTTLEEMDVDAVLARRPTTVLVDELAHTNAPGSEREKRWQDVETLLEAGIDVISTVNIQHLESVNDVVERITGVRQRETVPDVVVRRAEQVELVDMTPEALRRRMAHGNVYSAEKVDAALANYFRPGNLAALRELALLWVADKVDESLHDYLEAHSIADTWETRERIVVAVTGAPGGAELVRRAARMAARTRGDLIGVHVTSTSGLRVPTDHLDRDRALLRDLGGAYHELISDEPAKALTTFARGERATQLVLGASGRNRWQRLVRGDMIEDVLREAGPLDVHVIAAPPGRPVAPAVPRARGGSRLPRRRRRAGWVVGAVMLPLVTLALLPLRDGEHLSTVLLAYLAVVVATTAIGGPGPGLTSAVVAFLLENYFFVAPVRTFTIAKPENVVSLIGFLAFATAASLAVARLTERSRDAERARAEAEALARAAGAVAAEGDSLVALVESVRTIFGLSAVGLLRRDGEGWAAIATTGQAAPVAPEDGESFPVDDETVLVLAGNVEADDRLVVAAFANQAAAVLEARRLRREADEHEVLVRADALRTGLLRSVSHDLRTPLAAIKASVTSLLADDVTWSDDDERDFLVAIDSECDRLNRLVSDLLDASRLQAGTVNVRSIDVAVDDIVSAALASVADVANATTDVVVDVPAELPPIRTDPGLIERVLANLIANALRHSPPGEPVRVSAAQVADRLELLVADRGPGIPAHLRTVVVQPFERLGDQGHDGGVGLGLAVAAGFVELLGGRMDLDDTPGGGLTVTLSFPWVTA